jgi:membrane associated rhomboid family serine protease
MGNKNKLKKLVKTNRKVGEAESWIFSLVPILVAFVFYIMFIVSSEIEQKGLFIAYGAAAGIIGLETYWIVRGWRKNHGSTIVMGFIGIAITLGLLYLYLSFT